MRAFIPQCRRTQERVHHRVNQDIAVAVPGQAHLVRDVHAPQYQPAASHKRMSIEADADPEIHCRVFWQCLPKRFSD